MHQFLPRDASAERGYEIAFVCLSVCPSVCNDQVPCANRLEFFENNSRPNSFTSMRSFTPNMPCMDDMVQN